MRRDVLVQELTAAIDAATAVTQIDGVYARMFAARNVDRLTAVQWQRLNGLASEKRRRLLAVEADKYREGTPNA